MLRRLYQTQISIIHIPILVHANEDDTFFIYLFVFLKVVGSILIEEDGTSQDLVYFIINLLKGSEVRYQKVEKIELTLVTS